MDVVELGTLEAAPGSAHPYGQDEGEADVISITLPSIHPAKLDRAVQNIRDTTRGVYEIIVVSPFPPSRGSDIVWEPEDEPRGANRAHAAAIPFARGYHVLAWSDDHLLAPGWDDQVLAELSCLEVINPYTMLGLRHADVKHVGTCFGHYYPYFPFASFRTIERVGWYDPNYKRGFADCDLGLRVWRAGGFCAWSAPLVTRCEDDEKRLPDDEAGYEPEDLEMFLAHWRPMFGKRWLTRLVRDFNVDVVPEELRSIRDGTLRCESRAELFG